MKQNILLIATCLCGLATSSQAALIAWYKFDEAAGASTALNAVAGSTTGAIQAGVTTGVAGVGGTNAYSFNDSTGFVDMGNANFFSSINASGQLTFSVWINTTVTVGNRNVAVFAGLDTSNQSYTDLGYSNETLHPGNAYGRNRPNLNSGTQATGIFSDGVVVNDGNWHHLALTVNLSTTELFLYVDGTLTNGMTMTSSLFPAFNNFEVGRLGRGGSPGPTDYFGGSIDEVQVYNQALTSEQIQFLHNNPTLAIPEPSTIALGISGVGMLLLFQRRRFAKTA